MLFGTAFKIQRRCPFVDTYTERRTTNEHHEGDLFEVEVEGGTKLDYTKTNSGKIKIGNFPTEYNGFGHAAADIEKTLVYGVHGSIAGCTFDKMKQTIKEL